MKSLFKNAEVIFPFLFLIIFILFLTKLGFLNVYSLNPSLTDGGGDPGYLVVFGHNEAGAPPPIPGDFSCNRCSNYYDRCNIIYRSNDASCNDANSSPVYFAVDCGCPVSGLGHTNCAGQNISSCNDLPPSCSLSFSPNSPQPVANAVSIYPNATDDVGVGWVMTYVNNDPNGGYGSWDLIGQSSTGNVSWTTANSSHTPGTHIVAANVLDTANNFYQCKTNFTLSPPPLIPTPTPTNTPTPTATPTPAIVPWTKMKDASFQRSGALNTTIPVAPQAFGDGEDTATNYLIDGEAGVAASGGFLLNSYNASAKVSARDWKITNYSPASINRDGFVAYIKSKKTFTTITDVLQITSPGLYYYNPAASSITLPSPSYNYVLVVDGSADVKFASDNFNVAGGDIPSKSIAVLANSITFTDASATPNPLTHVYGVFVANTINTGTAPVGTELKIKGNLVAGTYNLNRSMPANNSKPSVFVVSYPKTYIDLMSYLSVEKYDWRQLQ